MPPVPDFTYDSFLLGRSLFPGDPRPFELVLFALIGCAVIWAVLEVVHRIGRVIIKQRLGINQLQQCLTSCRQIEIDLINRIFATKDALKVLGNETDLLRRRSDNLWQAVHDTQDLHGRHIRLLGQETKSNRCFVALIYNRHVEHWTRIGRSHAYIHDSWSKPQQIQVWARSEVEAKKLLMSRYPDTFGYVLMRMMVMPAASAEAARGP